MRSLLVLSLALASCAPPPPASSPAPPVPAPHECFASMARTRPAGWIDAGQLVVTVTGEQPTSIEIRDAAGKVLGTRPVHASSPQAIRQEMMAAVCDAGGTLGIVTGKPPAGSMTIPVLRPAKEDEPADLAVLCAEPKDMPAGVDPSQKVAIARQMYEERLTSTRYRRWIHHLDEAVHADDAPARARSLDELTAAAKGACWFADALRR